ncbi:HPr family phosphocarrier protein [bacterium]|nr:HPr family phosphocarrier protein [bacterium]
MVSNTITITHAVGLHARPATLFAQMAQSYDSEIAVTFDGKTVNAKSLLSLLSLGAMQGSCIDINAEGDDGEDAVAALSELVKDNFCE